MGQITDTRVPRVPGGPGVPPANGNPIAPEEWSVQEISGNDTKRSKGNPDRRHWIHGRIHNNGDMSDHKIKYWLKQERKFQTKINRTSVCFSCMAYICLCMPTVRASCRHLYLNICCCFCSTPTIMVPSGWQHLWSHHCEDHRPPTTGETWQPPDLSSAMEIMRPRNSAEEFHAMICSNHW